MSVENVVVHNLSRAWKHYGETFAQGRVFRRPTQLRFRLCVREWHPCCYQPRHVWRDQPQQPGGYFERRRRPSIRRERLRDFAHADGSIVHDIVNTAGWTAIEGSKCGTYGIVDIDQR